jgi:predicted ester cyclase
MTPADNPPERGEATRMDSETNKAVVRRFIEAINSQDFAALDELVTDDFVRHSGSSGQPQVRGLGGLKELLRREAATFPDAREAIHFLVAEGDKVAARLAFGGTQRGRWDRSLLRGGGWRRTSSASSGWRTAGSPRRGSSGTTWPP